MALERMKRAALYLRSSKDRSDVSIDAQRRELLELAAARNYLVVEEYADAVESGKDEDRPGFQRLLRTLQNSKRGWDHILVLNTSRIMRRVDQAVVFESQECNRRGVTIVYKSLPETDHPGVYALMKNVMRGVDEWHSWSSRLLGLAGMAENVRQGWRGAGNAPRGYKLERVATGAVRDGSPVTKSRLVPSDEAERIGEYLRARAAGVARKPLAARLGLPETSLIGMERNALTYAGHTPFNVRADGKRRPRSEWMIQRDTHKALITDEEAEKLLAGLETRKHTRRTGGEYLLTGLLATPSGEPWYGNGSGDYRHAPSRSTVRAEKVERLVLDQVRADLTSPALLDALVDDARRQVVEAEALDPAPLRARLTELTRQVARAFELAAELEDRGPALRRVDELERERRGVEARVLEAEAALLMREELVGLTPAKVRELLAGMVERLEDGSRDEVKECLNWMLERVELDPEARTCQLRYRVALDGARRTPSCNKQDDPWERHLIPVALRAGSPASALVARWGRRRA